jgi:hypothetical protein
VAARPAEFRPHRVAVYIAFGLVCGLLFLQLIRSVVGDLYGRPSFRPAEAGKATPTACLEDVDRLYHELAARAVQPAPRGLDQGLLAREWDLWARRWEAEIDSVSHRCSLGDPREPALVDLASALESLEDLRRELARSGEQASEEARRVRDALAAAREKLHLR